MSAASFPPTAFVFGASPVRSPILSDVRRGILGGTFDPPHLAHLMGGEAAYHELELDVVTFMPAGSPWQKAERGVSAASHRWRMTRLAIEGVEYFTADDREVRRPGSTYTIETLESLEESEEVVLILGADAAAGLPSWHRAEEVMKRVSIAVMPRPGVPRTEVDETIEGHSWLDLPALAVSGTMLRGRVRDGHSIRFYVPEAVNDYVMQHGLYG